MIGHKYTPTVGHTGIYACGDYVRRNLGATVVEARIPPPLGVGSVNERVTKSAWERIIVRKKILTKSTTGSTNSATRH